MIWKTISSFEKEETWKSVKTINVCPLTLAELTRNKKQTNKCIFEKKKTTI